MDNQELTDQERQQMQELLEAQYNRLLELEDNPTFRDWRSTAEKSFLQEVENLKLSVLTMKEADVKALILYEARIKAMFDSFKIAVKNRKEENIKK